jgi:enoyl-CoA hydratase/carnithine racemase
MALTQYTKVNSIGVLRLDNGVTNALNVQLIDEITEILEEIYKDRDCLGLILTSTNDKFFSIGFDVPSLYPLEPEEFERFYKRFNRICLGIYSLPIPTVAAITGHATGGGCILTLCCDFRYITEGKKTIGLPEIKLGVPVPFIADRIIRQILGDREASKIMYSGDFIDGLTATKIGLLDTLCKKAELLEAAEEKIITISQKSLAAFKAIKENRIHTVKTEIEQFLVEKESLFLEMWYSGTARRLLQGIMDKY